mmetsp:Transcript_12221/g.27502  ORF Transcript_12221/g.27502 Transcript_12221/m.27502 type:complete len:591 (-) Transcript_12221:82-1854(-)
MIPSRTVRRCLRPSGRESGAFLTCADRRRSTVVNSNVATTTKPTMALGGKREFVRQRQLALVRFLSSTADAATNVTSPEQQQQQELKLVLEQQESDPHRVLESLGMSEAHLFKIASQTPTSLKLGDMYKYANIPDKSQRLRNAQFLHRELPIRVAQRAVDLLTLPYGLSDATPIRQVACAYITYCHRMMSFPCPETYEQEEAFTDLLQSLVLDRTSIPAAIARGLQQWRKENQANELESERLQEMEDALYRFFTARVGLRFLTEHHVLSCHRDSAKDLRKVTGLFNSNRDDFSGCIHSSLDLVNEINRVADLVVEQTKDFYGISPRVEVVDCITDRDYDAGDFTYVPHHLHYMMGELIKNSCRATVRSHLAKKEQEQNDNAGGLLMGTLSQKSVLSSPEDSLPPIRVVVVKGDEDVTIKVADKGGGIPRSRMQKIWKFAHSTADEEEGSSEFGTDGISGVKLRGFGLPLCRIYARYLGGELTLKSMEGYGLDTYLHLPRLGVACENLPRLVQKSPGERDSTPGRNIRNFSTLSKMSQTLVHGKNSTTIAPKPTTLRHASGIHVTPADVPSVLLQGTSSSGAQNGQNRSLA